MNTKALITKLKNSLFEVDVIAGYLAVNADIFALNVEDTKVTILNSCWKFVFFGHEKNLFSFVIDFTSRWM